MKRIAFIPLAVILLVTAVVSCTKTPPPSPSSSQNVSTGPLAYFGGNNHNILYYFGTPFNDGCRRPCGGCHVTSLQIGYQPNTNDPENNEALAEISVMSNGKLLVSVDLNGVGQYYVNDIITTQHFTVAQALAFPQSVIDQACDRAGVPHWGGPVSMQAGNYNVGVDGSGNTSRFEIEGTYNAASGWTWTCFVR